MPLPALPDGDRFTLANVRVPACLVDRPGDLATLDLTIADGRIATGEAPRIDLRGAMLFPAFVDMHTPLDKGHIAPRAANPDGSFAGALATVADDRAARWSREDLRRRMDFGLRAAFAHGTRAIRTHLDSTPPQQAVSWPVFSEMRAEWAGRIALQAVCLVGVEEVDARGPFPATADLVAEAEGVLGMVAYPVPDLDARIRTFLDLASARRLDVDLHVDETGDPAAAGLRAVAEAVLETGFAGRVTVGHCCSLAAQPERTALATLDLVARAGLAVVSLPMCNLYLQDRAPGRTPRWRGVTLVHEMHARGIPVAFASDNARDPFYAYGDLDMLEVMREATRICHLDHGHADWPRAFLTTPAEVCGFAPPSLAPGAPADLVIFAGRRWSELLARPQSDRIVVRAGRPIDARPPDYSELDDLHEAP